MFAVPASFIQHLYENYGQVATDEWLAKLPTLLDECAQRWQLQILPPLPRLSFHYIAPVMRADGSRAILKTCSLTDEFPTGTLALRYCAGQSMVRLLEFDEVNEVALLEYLEPGTTLSPFVPERDEQATSILATVMKRIWRPAPVGQSFPTVEKWARGLSRLRERYQGGNGPFPAHLLDEAETLFHDLPGSAGPALLLHGDLHHENVLLAGDAWKAIDPKGVIGDPGYEVGAMMYNPLGWIHLVSDPRRLIARRVDQLAEELAMDRARVRGWGLAQCVLSAWWSIEDSDEDPPQDVLTCAELLASLPG
jgi:streptomycin 6-kinase